MAESLSRRNFLELTRSQTIAGTSLLMGIMAAPFVDRQWRYMHRPDDLTAIRDAFSEFCTPEIVKQVDSALSHYRFLPDADYSRIVDISHRNWKGADTSATSDYTLKIDPTEPRNFVYLGKEYRKNSLGKNSLVVFDLNFYVDQNGRLSAENNDSSSITFPDEPALVNMIPRLFKDIPTFDTSGWRFLPAGLQEDDNVTGQGPALLRYEDSHYPQGYGLRYELNAVGQARVVQSYT